MIVAIARELGAGGRSVGDAVAAALRIPLLDNEIVNLVAQRIGAPASYVAERDEQPESFTERVLRGITAAYPESLSSQGLPDWSEERLVELTETIIKERAASESIVVIGRGAPILLKDRPDVVRVFVTAPQADRVARIERRLGLSADEALKELRKSDQHRGEYFKEFYNVVDWRDPRHYDLVVNTARFGIEGAAKLVVEAARSVE
ncbi:MAG TPA: cytidylate kinase-like family protein [Candidatus Eremiobacteraceae bacterium]|nr:cytidylate kinase-like family protein [Candidatus Eremiobacteraceae bacterium]